MSGPERPAAEKESELCVRSANDADVEAVARLHVRAWQSAYQGQMPAELLAGLDPAQRARMWRRVVFGLGHGLEVATRASEVVGFCHLMRSRDVDTLPHVGEISSIYVAPEHWGAGIGRALLESSVERALRRRYRTLTLWVLAFNASARSFYERLGFAPDGESKQEDRGSFTLQELRYRRVLSAAPAS
jgi:GNAT superfamily N-acetyltransferase